MRNIVARSTWVCPSEPTETGNSNAIGRAKIAVVGCGALGGQLAQTLVRCGIGSLVLVDRDVVDWTNLARQVLFDERHAHLGEAKVAAALETLERIGGPTRLLAHAAHLDAANIEELAAGCDVVLDCVGSAETLQQSLAVVAPRGAVVVVGMPAAVKLELTTLWHRETTLVGAYAYGTETLPSGEYALSIVPSASTLTEPMRPGTAGSTSIASNDVLS